VSQFLDYFDRPASLERSAFTVWHDMRH